MLVSNLRDFIKLLAPPLKAAGLNQSAGKSVTDSLDALAAALAPFEALNTDQLAELLRFTEEYRGTGVIPDWVLAKKPAAASKAPQAPKAPKLSASEALARLRELQERALGMELFEIERDVQALSPLTLKEIQEVQRGIFGHGDREKKDDALAAILKKVIDSRASRDRVAGILAY